MLPVQVNNCVYHVRKDGPWEQAGSGPVVVFSNSLGTDLRVWDPLLPHLPDDWRLLRYDTAGHGLSGFPGQKPIADHAADLAGILRSQNISKAVIIGLSVGGLIAQALVRDNPDLVSGLILMDTASKIGSDDVWNDRLAAIDDVGLAGISDAVIERWFSKKFRSNRTDELALWQTMLVRTPDESYKALCMSIRDADFSADAGNISVPTLAVAGSEDGATPPDVVRATAQSIPGAVFHEIPGAGHLPCVEVPETLAHLIITFFRENGFA